MKETLKVLTSKWAWWDSKMLKTSLKVPWSVVTRTRIPVSVKLASASSLRKQQPSDWNSRGSPQLTSAAGIPEGCWHWTLPPLSSGWAAFVLPPCALQESGEEDPVWRTEAPKWVDDRILSCTTSEKAHLDHDSHWSQTLQPELSRLSWKKCTIALTEYSCLKNPMVSHF